MRSIEVTFTLNAKEITLLTPPGRTLLEVLREDLSLTGVKEACGGEGECGACTVLLDGQAVNSCLVLIPQVQGHSVLTIEGLCPGGRLHPIQKAFMQAGAVQCGFCTPGMVLATKALLDQTPNPNEEEIRTALSGNLCRCTGYTKIIEAVKIAASEVTHAG
jgi:aerobic-type carbon monoxide dehydrogenase small subunit (CoxS/CutS family)